MKHLLLACTVLALTPALAFAQDARSAPDRDVQSAQRAGDSGTFIGPRRGSREATLSGTGSNDNDFDSGSLGITGSLGYYTTDALLLGARQTFNWFAARNAEDRVNGSTRLFADYHFNTTGRLRPFVGLNFGYVYGGGVDDTWAAAPEIGLKYYVNSTTFIHAQTEYQFFFESGSGADDAFDDGSFVHTIGLGFNF